MNQMDNDFPLLSETVEVRGRSFTVRELTMDELMPIIDDDSLDDAERTRRLFSAAVRMNGQPVQAGKLPAPIFSKLSEAVAKVNNLNGDEENAESGNA